MSLCLSEASVIILAVTSSKKALYPGRRQLIILAVLVLVAIVLVPQLDGFSDGLHLLRKLNWPGTAAAACLVMFTYFLAAATYYFLAFEQLPYYRTVWAQYAAMFINRLLPSGVGALGVNYVYLHKMRHTPAQAAAIVGVNNLFGLIGHALVFGTVIILFNANTPPLNLPSIAGSDLWVVGVVASLLCLTLVLVPRLRRKLLKTLRDIMKQLARYRHRPGHLLAALSSSTILTLCNIFSLSICLQAVGGHLSFAAIVIVFTIGIGAGTATPTPGGLGGTEAGLLAGFVAYGVPESVGLAAVILYRILSYWLTLATGALAFAYCQRRDYFGLN